MGNPLSSLLAELLMDNLQQIIQNHCLRNKIIGTDLSMFICLCFTDTSRQLETIENFVHSVHPNIQITTEPI